jgi:hypothetical protein
VRARGRLARRRRALAFRAMSPFWIWTQALIVVCVLAGIVIAIVKLA